MKTIRVVLEITYDDNHNKSPVDWNWHSLLELSLDEQVKLIPSGKMTHPSNQGMHTRPQKEESIMQIGLEP
jgi:hypothetical protein